MDHRAELKEIAKLFLKLGIIGFGGPAAHIAMMQQEVVVKRKWLNDQQFLDLLGATNLIPGPNSTEMAIHIGYEKGKWKGLLIAGLCFILPAVFITGFFAWLYQKFGQLPEVQPFIYGIKPAVIAIIIAAVFPLAKKSVKSTGLAIIGSLVLVGSFLGIGELFLLFGSGAVVLVWKWLQNRKNQSLNLLLPLVFLQAPAAVSTWATNTKLFWIFLKIGAVLYGSGYVLFAFLDTELVATGILTKQQLIDAVAVGQITPGPVFSAVTFVGYQIGGWSGALVSTMAIFLPSFLFVALLVPLVKKMRSSVLFSAFLDGVNVAAVAVIAAVCYEMSRESITDWRTVIIAAAGIALAFGFRRINSAFIVLGGALLGYILYWV